MTEKRFTVDYDITVGNYCLHDKEKDTGVDGYITYLSSEERANNLCTLLNEQDAEIKRLKCINRQLEERLDRSIALDMSRCGKYIYGIHGGSNDK